MEKRKPRVAMALSGGVDSSVAASLLLKQGYDVIGLHMKLHNETVTAARRCCSLDDSLDARSVCDKLGIPFYILNFMDEFQESVIDYFVHEYSIGRTPNPCAMCNRTIKIHALMEKVEELECDYLATGHYAQVDRNPETGRLQLKKPADLRRDQTYFLYGTRPEELERLLFPLAEYQKQGDVRKFAEGIDSALAEKKDSQEVCFVSQDYRPFVMKKLGYEPEPGDFVDVEGKVLGKHQGIPFYTIGQRRGLGVSGPHPYYVVRLDRETNQVVLGRPEDCITHEVDVNQVNWVSIEPPTRPFVASVKLRYSHRESAARILPRSDHEVDLELLEPVKSVAPGQAAVFYQGDVVLGGGWIQHCR